MLMALLYTDDDFIAAAAPACDQVPYGEGYWHDIHAAEIPSGSMFETAYVTIANSALREKMMMLGIDEKIDGHELAIELVRSLTPPYLQRAA